VLPDYPEAKKHLQKEFIKALRKESEKDPIINMIHVRRSYEGNAFEFETEDGFSQSGSYKLLASKFEISKDEVIEKGPDAYFLRIPQIAKEWIDKQSRLLFQKMEEVTAATGNIVDAKSKPISPELILAALDKIAINFDEFGNPIVPSIVLHPSKLEAMKKEFGRFQSDPILLVKYKFAYKLIMDKKRQEWYDRESNRKLVD
jgi:hypothetical protein